jgi:hypothetical protein
LVKAAIDPAGTADLYWAAVAIEKLRNEGMTLLFLQNGAEQMVVDRKARLEDVKLLAHIDPEALGMTFRYSLPIQDLSQLLRFLLSMLTEGFGLVNPIIINHKNHPQVITMLVVSLPSPVVYGRSHVLQPELHVRGKNRPGNPGWKSRKVWL